MRKFKQGKLWRDRSIECLEKQGSYVHWRKLNHEDFDHQLRLKLLEEAEEVATSKTQIEMINELADLFEVIDTLKLVHGIDNNIIIKAQQAKQKERGGFLDRKFVEFAQHPVGSPGEQYCLSNPKKYPELK